MKKQLLFIVAAIVSCMTIFAQEPEVTVVASGNCGKVIKESESNQKPNELGDNLKWTLTSDGVLKITGTGELGDSKAFGTIPWADHRNDIKSVIIEEGCTSIGKFSFHTCNKMANVQLPSTLKKIGDMSFMAFPSTPSSLKSIEIPAGVEQIGESAFMGSVLESIKIPEGIKELKTGVLMNCKKLAKVELPQSLETIGMNAINQCDVLESIVIPENVKSIGLGAFWKCKKLKEVTLPENIEHIAGKAFTETPWYNEWLSKQEDGPVYMVTTLYAYKGSMEAGTVVDVKAGTKYIGAESFKENSNIAGINLPEGLKAIESDAFYKCSSLGNVELPTSLSAIEKQAFRETKIDSIVVPDRVKRIETNTFYKCAALKNITLPRELNYIGQSAFLGCAELETIELPSKVAEMSSEVFKKCTKLTNIKVNAIVPAQVKNDTFAELDVEKVTLQVPQKGLETYKATPVWNTFTNIESFLPGGVCGDNATWAMDEAGTLTVTGTGDMWDWNGTDEMPWADYKSDIKKVVLEEGMTSIGVFSFHTCSQIAEIKLPSTIKSIGDMAFMQFPFLEKNHIETIELPEGITYIGSSAFYGTALKSVKLPTTVDTIQTGVFMSCDSLRTVEMQEGLKVIGMNAFNQCPVLETLVLPETLDSIGPKAFFKTNLKRLEFKGMTPPAVPTAEKDDPFSSAKKDFEFVVPMEAEAAYKADAYWKQFTNIEISLPSGECGDNATWELNAEGVLTISGTGDMWDWNGTDEMPWAAYRANVKKVVLEEGITSIGVFSFHTFSKIEDIQLPSTMKSIGDMAFMQFPFIEKNYIESIELPEGITYIGSSAFYGTMLKSVVIPSTVDTIQTGVFMSCDSLRTVEMPEGLKVIGLNAFGMCKSLRNVVIPSTVDSIGDLAFKMNKIERFELLGTVPPAVEGDPFENTPHTFEFIVPEAADAAYRADAYWKQFMPEIETDVEETENTDVVIYSNGSELVIEGAEGNVTIFNVTGAVVYTGNDKVVELPRGIYVVRGENFCEKVVL